MNFVSFSVFSYDKQNNKTLLSLLKLCGILFINKSENITPITLELPIYFLSSGFKK